MDRQEIMVSLVSGERHRFNEAARLMTRLGFEPICISRLHRVYAHPDIPELITLHNANGDLIPFQARLIHHLMQAYELEILE